MKKDFITIKNLAVDEINYILDLAFKMKMKEEDFGSLLAGKTIGLIFQKPSNRTRVSFDVGMTQMGGHTVYLGPDELKIGVREKTSDIAKTLSRYLDGIVARTFSHEDILELAEYASVSVINGLSDLLHPCQGLSDVFTVKEKKGALKGIKLAYVGDGNNVVHSLLYACSKVGTDISIATPKGYEPDKDIVQDAIDIGKSSNVKIELHNKPHDAVKDADVIYTDVWASMGRESEAKKRKKHFKDFQVNAELVALAKPDCIIMHCLPAHRGEEISEDVIDGPNSVVFDQAENRMHVQKAILSMLLK